MKINRKFRNLLNMRRFIYMLSAVLSAFMLVAVVLWGCAPSTSRVPISDLAISYYGKILLPGFGEENAFDPEVFEYRVAHTNYHGLTSTDIASAFEADHNPYVVKISDVLSRVFSTSKISHSYTIIDDSTGVLEINLHSRSGIVLRTYKITIELLPRVTQADLTGLLTASMTTGVPATSYPLQFTEDTVASTENDPIFTSSFTVLSFAGASTFSATIGDTGTSATLSAPAVSIDSRQAKSETPYDIVVTEIIPSDYPDLLGTPFAQKVTYRLLVTIIDPAPPFAISANDLVTTTLAGYYTGDFPATLTTNAVGTVYTFTMTGLTNRIPADYPTVAASLFDVTNALTIPVDYEFLPPVGHAYEIDLNNASIASATFADPSGKGSVPSRTLATFEVEQIAGIGSGMTPLRYTIRVEGGFAAEMESPTPTGVQVAYQGSPNAAVVPPSPARPTVYVVNNLTNRLTVNENSVILPNLDVIFEYAAGLDLLALDTPSGNGAFPERDLGISFTVQERYFPLNHTPTFTARGAFAAQLVLPAVPVITVTYEGSPTAAVVPPSPARPTVYTINNLTNRNSAHIYQNSIEVADSRFEFSGSSASSIDTPSGTGATGERDLVGSFTIQEKYYPPNHTQTFTARGAFAAQFNVPEVNTIFVKYKGSFYNRAFPQRGYRVFHATGLTNRADTINTYRRIEFIIDNHFLNSVTVVPSWVQLSDHSPTQKLVTTFFTAPHGTGAAPGHWLAYFTLRETIFHNNYNFYIVTGDFAAQVDLCSVLPASQTVVLLIGGSSTETITTTRDSDCNYVANITKDTSHSISISSVTQNQADTTLYTTAFGPVSTSTFTPHAGLIGTQSTYTLRTDAIDEVIYPPNNKNINITLNVNWR